MDCSADIDYSRSDKYKEKKHFSCSHVRVSYNSVFILLITANGISCLDCWIDVGGWARRFNVKGLQPISVKAVSLCGH